MSAQHRRQQLVDIGLDLLETRPIQDLTLDEVAVAAGVSRTLVFHYFPSKGDYFAEIVASAGQRLMQAVPRDPDMDPEARLRSMVDAFLRFVKRKRGAYVALVRGASGGDPKVLAALDAVRAEHVGRWLDAAGWRRRDELTLVAVRAWLASLEEVAFVAATSTLPRAALVELLVEGLLSDLEHAGQLAEGVADPALVDRTRGGDRAVADRAVADRAVAGRGAGA
jgi:AcrR family transcriptional regulator